MFAAILILEFLSPSFAQEPGIADSGPPVLENQNLNSKSSVPPKDPISRSWVPILGVNPVYGFFFGGGFFFEKRDRFSFDIAAIGARNNVLKADVNTGVRLADRWRMEIHNEIASGFVPNYGAGNQTKVEDRVDLPMLKDFASLKMLYEIRPRLSVGLMTEYKMRRNREETLSAEDLAKMKDPFPEKEDTFGFGLLEILDLRDRPESPSFGWTQSFSAKLFPEETQSGDAKTFFQLEMDIRMFQYILNRDLVLATSVSAGTTFGKPSYLNEFRLGGNDRLRGFYENRFRGSRFYLQQNELRFPIWGILSGATFLEFGEASTGDFNTPSMSYGVGLRLGLPPDMLAKVRLEFAFSKDQNGIFIDFGQAF